MKEEIIISSTKAEPMLVILPWSYVVLFLMNEL
jgi:hypothetical protein